MADDQRLASVEVQIPGLMDMPDEILLKIIDEVILYDRSTGADHIRERSSSLALSRVNNFFKNEVEPRYQVLYLRTSLFPTFAQWTVHSDWLFHRDKFSVVKRKAATQSSISETRLGSGVGSSKPLDRTDSQVALSARPQTHDLSSSSAGGRAAEVISFADVAKKMERSLVELHIT